MIDINPVPKRFPDPRSASASKSLRIITQKTVNNMIQNIQPDPDLDFLPITDPGSRIQGSKKDRIPGPQH
jgi:hypothetical protein